MSCRGTRPSRPFAILSLLGAGLLGACTNVASTEPGDSPADAGKPSALGNGLMLAEINNPSSPTHATNDQMNVAVTGVQFVVQDEYNETGTASAVGSVYVQDFHSNAPDAGGAPPFSGITLYKPTYEPASLVLAPGDVIDLTGEYQEYSYSGPNYTPEMYEPVVVTRFDYGPPNPTVVPAATLANYAGAFPYLSMLVTVENTIGGSVYSDGKGRNSVYLTSDVSSTGLSIDNQLYDLDYANPAYAAAGGTHFKSVTGIVTYFIYSGVHISPRSAADIVLE